MTIHSDTNHTVLVRSANADDVLPLSYLFDAYRQFYGKAPDLALAHTFLADRIRKQDSTILVAIANDGEMAGFTQLYPTFSSVSAQEALILNDLFVGTTYRKRGVGRVLLDAAINTARQKSVAWVSLQTAKTNTAAQSLYRSMGFVRDDYFDRYAYVFQAATER
ncbi:N-acetyltransferase family protein [Robbsia andropogonis]|uniref:GNAT family N-acetyltransferase n=1 Tax=Robbsia andropogonis TaxID=28092 RepID=UPI003D232AA8